MWIWERNSWDQKREEEVRWFIDDKRGTDREDVKKWELKRGIGRLEGETGGNGEKDEKYWEEIWETDIEAVKWVAKV